MKAPFQIRQAASGRPLNPIPRCVSAHRRYSFLTALLAGSALFTGNVQAAGVPEESGFVLRGFGTVGMVRSSSNQAEFIRDLSQSKGSAGDWNAKLDSNFGLQAEYQANTQLQFVAQAISHYRYDRSFRPEMTWAFAKYDVNPGLSLRAGRLGTEFYLAADSREIGYAYLTVRPPGDYYAQLPFHYIDGADVALTVPLGDGLLKGKAYVGLTREKLPLADKVWDINDSLMSGGYLNYQRGPWMARVGYAQIRFNDNLPLNALYAPLRALGAGAVADRLSMNDKVGAFSSFGVVYDDGPLQAVLMLSDTRQESDIMENARAGYLAGGYRVGAMTPFLGYSWVKSKAKAVPSGTPLALVNPVARAMADSHSDQHTVFFGARWDVVRNVALKAQYDLVRGTPGSIFPTRWELPGWTGRTNVLSFTLDYVF